MINAMTCIGSWHQQNLLDPGDFYVVVVSAALVDGSDSDPSPDDSHLLDAAGDLNMV